MPDETAGGSRTVEQPQREIKKIAARIHRCKSMHELDHAWATLVRLQNALVIAMQRAKALAD